MRKKIETLLYLQLARHSIKISFSVRLLPHPSLHTFHLGLFQYLHQLRSVNSKILIFLTSPHFFIHCVYLTVVSDSDELIDADNQDIELEPCAICMRTFIPDALEKHVAICEKMRHQRRTPFDSFRQRRGGTNLESYSPSNYGLIAKPKASKSPYLEHKASSKSTVCVFRWMCFKISSMYLVLLYVVQICTDAPIKLSIQQRVSPPKSDGIKAGSKETPLLNRSIKRTTGTINEVCPQCGRSFGSRAYDRHVEWCREKAKIAYPTLSAQQHIARERMQARTKYKAPSVR